MGREIRRVPPGWEHPKKRTFNFSKCEYMESFQPLHNMPYSKAIGDWIRAHDQWKAGVHEDQAKRPEYRTKYPHYAQYAGNPPSVEYYRPEWPEWPEDQMTWFQVYETVSEGTPVTPPFATREELVEYLVANGDYWDQQRRAEGRPAKECGPWSRVNAERFVFGEGSIPSMIIDHGVVKTGQDCV